MIYFLQGYRTTIDMAMLRTTHSEGIKNRLYFVRTYYHYHNILAQKNQNSQTKQNNGVRHTGSMVAVMALPQFILVDKKWL